MTKPLDLPPPDSPDSANFPAELGGRSQESADSDDADHQETPANDLKDMPITAHLIELRDHLVRIFIAVIVLFVGLIYFAKDLFYYFSLPLKDNLPEGAEMIATQVGSPFLTPIKLALFVALFIAMPYVLHQVWQFIAPGLYKKEKKVAIPLLFSSILLFYAGVAFAYFVVLPGALKFLLLFAQDVVTPMTDINHYMDFAMKLFLAFGVTFEIPIAVFILVLVGAVSTESLEDKRRYIIVGCFAVAAVVTPPDGLSMIMLAVPMWLLFELGLFAAKSLINKQQPEEI